MNGEPVLLLAVKVVEAAAWAVDRRALTVSWKVFDEVWATGVVLSVAVTVKVVVDNRALGVPEICPVDVEKLSPVGRAPPLRA